MGIPSLFFLRTGSEHQIQSPEFEKNTIEPNHYQYFIIWLVHGPNLCAAFNSKNFSRLAHKVAKPQLQSLTGKSIRHGR